ncbi:putative sterigmatocystin biosynthesis monooxygenase STCB [Glarea lozoyensis 74030]|uniref:Putative sterigmatocystin biosynthesis monooxygenase STCB n=1 Tax=Glarea lozoyensis (strain ATCC 74030 / MF5533) TaxID=1104152 RepID=H0ESE5_GLAL7|nr:putative sterigmatocystin biosynthesis monooxygenase STCB [Glarea lozoyensis 74030]
MDAFTAYQFGLGLGTNFIQDVKTRDWYLGNYFAIRPYMFWIGDGYKIWSLLMRIGVNIIPTKVLDAFPEIQAYNLELCDKAEALLSDARALSIEDVPVIYSQERSAMRKDIDAKRFQNPHFLKTEQDYPRRLEIASDMFDMNAAALETSGITLTYLYYELSRHPELQTKLRQELLTLSPTFSFPVPEGQEPELPDSKEVDRLPLLDAILQETLRLYQAVPGRQPRITPAKGCTLAGYSDIPGGVVVQSYGSVLHRNPAVFPDPANWKPERWLNAGEEELKEMKRWFWAFGSGGRMCVGTHVAIHKTCILNKLSKWELERVILYSKISYGTDRPSLSN